MTIAQSLLIGIISGVISSLLFLISLFLLKPRIEISDKICTNSEFGNTYYFIKTINKTWWTIYDIKVELSLLQTSSTKGGKIYKVDKIELRREPPFQIPRFSKKDKDAFYAVLFSTESDLDTLWTKDTHSLKVVISARHNFSGFGNIFTKEYFSKEHAIHKGKFEFGNSLQTC